MKSTVYLVCNEKGPDRIVKKRVPVMRSGEVAIKLTVEIPSSAFRPTLADALLKIDEDHIIKSPLVDVTVDDPPDEFRLSPWELTGT